VPEGHTIHRLARGLNASLRDAPVHAWSPQGRFEQGAALIDGRPLLRANAWGKYLFCDFGIGEVLFVHLGLIGKFRPQPSPPREPVGMIRLRLEGAVDDDGGGTTWDLSGPSRCELVDPVERRRIVAGLGADPLRRAPDTATARERLARTARPIGATLLDQSIIAGIGNVYRAEILFLCGIDPRRPSRTLSDAEFEELWSTTVELMRIGVRMGRIVTTDPAEIGRPRSRMRSAERLYVYHQQHCRRCGTELLTVEVGGRPISYCPVHQT
jgi:endonuclease-8